MNATVQHAIGVRRIRVAGWGLSVLAFVIPVASAAIGYGSAAHAGIQVVQLAIGLAGLIGATNMALKADSALVQSCGRVVIGVVLILWALGSAWQQFQIAKLNEFLVEEQQMMELEIGRLANLNNRLDATHLDTVFTAEGLSSDAGIAAGRATISNFRALLTERNSQVTNSFTAIEHFVNTRSPDEDVKRKTLAVLKGHKDAAISNYGALNAVQSAQANAISDILDWAATQRGKLAIENGNFAIASPQQRSELLALVKKVQAIDIKQQQVVQAMDASQKKALASSRENYEKLQQMVK